ncbi:MAG: cell division protein FtsZ [Tidjanibacter sp.]|nr:cell division protein FtsZ [Tidjanibacter sp.]
MNEHLKSISAAKKAITDILVMGVGGAGGNAVNHMFDRGIRDVTFMVCNTDHQALEASPIEKKIQLGSGRGAGNNPDKGKQLAIESLDEIMLELENSKARMIFITAGMGGGTGTGAAPVIAKAAKSKGLLTVAVVTLPFKGEGPTRMGQALKGVEELRNNTDSIVLIHNDNISKIYGSLPVVEAFHKADDVLASAVKGIAEIITSNSFVNVDLEDARTTMTDSGVAVMGSARAKGENKVDVAVEQAISSPLLGRSDIKGAKKILLSIAYANDSSLTFDEAMRAVDLIQARASLNPGAAEASIIWGGGPTDTLDEGEVEITVIATSFEQPSRKEEGKEGEFNLPAGEEESEESIRWNFTEKYKDVDNMLIEPAYFRRGMQLTGSTPGGSRASVGDVLDGGHTKKESNPRSEESTPSLFDE